ncbi:cubilin-like [Ptychodera flava]|uniref:cubilin-like n=1 Tax=Ptychodera flava TaxID=63121 RepID=UPI003969DB3B
MRFYTVFVALACLAAVNAEAKPVRDEKSGEKQRKRFEIPTKTTKPEQKKQYNSDYWRTKEGNPIQICGREFMLMPDEEMVITSPNYPNNYDAGENCVTIVTAPEGAEINVQVTDFEVECCCDHLTLNDVEQTCDDYFRERTTMSSNQLLVSFVSDSSVQASGYSITVSAEIPDTISCTTSQTLVIGEELFISSPNYPSPYNAYDECISTVDLPELPEGIEVYVQVLYLDIECCCDHLEINDIAQECNNYYNERTEVTGDQVVIRFTSDGSVQYSGFSLNVWTEASPIQICGGEFTVMPGEEMVITSPNYPSNYDAGENCVTTVTAAEGAEINVQVTDFEVECCCDHLTLNDVEQTCDDYFRERTDLSSNQLTVSFVSDWGFQYSGYSITVSAEIPDTISCTTSQTLVIGEELFISSPNYPSAYNTNDECITTVDLPELPDGIEVYVQVLYLNIECCCDHLEINDIAQECNNYYNERTEVTGDQVVIRFTSDGSVQYNGFSLKVWTERNPIQICGGEFTLMPGEEMVITSPNYPSTYDPGENCVTTVTAPEGAEINVQVTDFEVECCCDHLTLNDVEQTCDDYFRERTTMSSNQLLVSFVSDSSVQASGYSITVSAEIPDTISCTTSQTLVIGEELFISSPNYPSAYNAYDECITTVISQNCQRASRCTSRFSIWISNAVVIIWR